MATKSGFPQQPLSASHIPRSGKPRSLKGKAHIFRKAQAAPAASISPPQRPHETE